MLLTADQVVTGTEVYSPGWVEIAQGTVTAMGAGAGPRAVDTAQGDVALGGVTVVPGFVDMHTHGGGSGAFPDATEDGVEPSGPTSPSPEATDATGSPTG